jgi:hypothetical protein
METTATEYIGTGCFDFTEWCEKFRNAGFEVNTFAEDGVCSATIKGKGIWGAFSELGAWYKTLDGKFAADNEKCFDKWSKCPLVVNMPCDFDALLKHLDFLASAEGYEISNNYSYFHNNPFPYDMSVPL